MNIVHADFNDPGLWPCPFCGGQPELLAQVNVRCTECGVVVTLPRTEQAGHGQLSYLPSAADRWQMRALDLELK